MMLLALCISARVLDLYGQALRSRRGSMPPLPAAGCGQRDEEDAIMLSSDRSKSILDMQIQIEVKISIIGS
jgi:hypothetical protein